MGTVDGGAERPEHEPDERRRAELDAGDPAERLIEEFERFEREYGPEAAAAAAQLIARLRDEFSGDELQRAALHRMRELEEGDE